MVYFLSNLRLYEKKVYIVFLINIRNGDVFHTWLNIRHKKDKSIIRYRAIIISMRIGN